MKVPLQLSTERLILRRHRMADLEAFAAFLAHPTATQYMAFTPEQKTAAGAQRMLEYVIAAYESGEPVFSLTLADPQKDEYLGSCGLNPLTSTDVEIYYTVTPEHQGRGLATEAAQALVEYVWRETDVQQIVAHIISENAPSARVAQKLGFLDQGPVHRKATTGELAHEQRSGRRYVLTRKNG